MRRKTTDIVLAVLMCIVTGNCLGALLLSAPNQDKPARKGSAMRGATTQEDLASSLSAVIQWINSHESTDNEREAQNLANRQAVHQLSVSTGVIQSQYQDLVRRMDDFLFWLRTLLVGVITNLLGFLAWVIKSKISPAKPTPGTFPCDQDTCPYTLHHEHHREAPEPEL